MLQFSVYASLVLLGTSACGHGAPTQKPPTDLSASDRNEVQASLQPIHVKEHDESTWWENMARDPTADSERVGRVLPEMMVAAVRAQGKTFTSCMSGQKGKATFDITVAADGSVLRVNPMESNLKEPQMKCLIAAWFRAGFPPPIGSARARAVIPLVFE